MRVVKGYLFLIALVIGGCSHVPPSPTDNPAEKEKIDPRRLALATVRYEPKGMLGPSLHTHGEGALGGAAAGAGGAVLGTLYGMTMLGPVAVIVLPVALPIAMIAGTAEGASTGTSAEVIEQSKQGWSKAVRDLHLQERLRNRLLMELQRERVGEQVLVRDDIGPLSPDDRPGYDYSVADRVLEAGVEEIKFWPSTGKQKEKRYALQFRLKARLIETRTQAVIDQMEYGFGSASHTSEEWLLDGAAMLERSIEEGVQQVASEIVREFFRLYYPPRNLEPGESHESGAPFYVLRPVYPIEPNSMFKTIIPDVDSLQPTLSWEAFPRSFDSTAVANKHVSFTEVAYELEIHQVKRHPIDQGFLLPIRYAYEKGPLHLQRVGLNQSAYTLEKPLEPCGYYSWSVRARFLMNGQPRVMEWSGRYYSQYQPWYARRVNMGYWAQTGGFRFRAPPDNQNERCPE